MAPLPAFEAVVVTLAVARLGAVVDHTDDLAPHVATARVLVAGTDPGLETGDVPVVTVDDSTELSWAMVMRAGRTDPAGCADVARGRRARPAGGVGADRPRRARRGRRSRYRPAPTVLDVGGLALWSRRRGGGR